MKFYIDCEFNSWKGELISMALVSSNAEFYEVIEMTEEVHPWVAANVIPVLGKQGTDLATFQGKLKRFINSFSEVEIIADYPDDISYFCRALITGAGTTIRTSPVIKFTLDYNASANATKVPHNALEDARAIQSSMEE